MFGSIGITEILLIAGLALIFLGPEKFPDFAKIVARTVRDVRSYMAEAQDEITKELRPVQQELSKIKNEDAETYFEKLADLAEADDDTEIAPEPDPSDWYEQAMGEELETTPESPSPAGAVPFGSNAPEAADSEETTEPSTESPERLDG